MAGQLDANWSKWRRTDEFTVGVEEEVMLLDPRDWDLEHDFDELAPRLSEELGDSVSPETHGAAIEVETRPYERAADAAAELAALRRRLADEVGALGRAVAGAGTHPFVTWRDTEVSDSERPRYVHQTMRELARREPTYALHVHVAVPGAERAIDTANRMRAHLPVLLALSANSPFWQGRDSGMASIRTPIFQAFPRVGVPRRFHSYHHYIATLETLIACGAFPEPTYVWWDLRLQPRYGTIEVRVMDTQSDPSRNGPIIALVQCLVRLEATEGYVSPALVEAQEVLEENRFLAARDGTRAELLDPVVKGRISVHDAVETLLEVCAPHAAELGCEAELARVPELLAEPADERQREIAGRPPDLVRLARELSECFAGAGAARA